MNVLEKDVGKYICIVYVVNIGKLDVVEGIIDFKLYESGKWICLVFLKKNEFFFNVEINMFVFILCIC